MASKALNKLTVLALASMVKKSKRAGKAVANLLSGDVNPSGKLPMTMPYHAGQVPIYYNYLNTGRPQNGPDDKRWGVAKFSDCPNEPLYAFGFGLSYTTFEYGEPKLNTESIGFNDTLRLSIPIKNVGDFDGTEVVQLYIRDLYASVSRPVKELKKFRRVAINAGESKEIVFEITQKDLKYWNDKMEFVADTGEFEVQVGASSENVQTKIFTLNN